MSQWELVGDFSYDTGYAGTSYKAMFVYNGPINGFIEKLNINKTRDGKYFIITNIYIINMILTFQENHK